jgi:hypothetical protein
VDRFITVAGMTISAVWLLVLATVTVVERWFS